MSLFLAAAALAALQEPRQDLAALLERARAAAAGGAEAASATGVVARGTEHVLGLDFQYELMYDPRSGAFRESSAGALPKTTTWSGSEGWVRDWNGTTYPLQLREREEALLTFAVMTSAWLRPGAPYQVELLQADDGGEALLGLRVQGGSMQAKLRLHLASARPSALELVLDGGPSTLLLSDWDGGLAHTVSLQREDELMHIHVDSVGPAPTFVRNPYQEAAAYPEDAHFDAHAPAELEAKRALSGHILVRPRVNGQEQDWFFFDSGAGGLVLDQEDAGKLGLKPLGEVPAVGVGGEVRSQFCRADSLQLGPLTMDHPVFVTMDLSFLETALNMKIGGIIGFEVLSRAVAEVDQGAGKVSLHDPRSYQLPRGEWQELLLDNHLPVVRGRFEGDHDALFRLDTGAGDTITFMTPTVEKYHMLEGREVQTSLQGGVGGVKPASRGTLEWLEIGGQRLENLSANFSQADAGAMSDSALDGNVGTGILSRFLLVFDYFHQRIAFLPHD